ncbi:MAG: sulfatase-like hydrolase/transferase [Myxococcales bacterium]|nr:sulfatase-like hydrolase/transferase [Myxococcales bacterium]
MRAKLATVAITLTTTLAGNAVAAPGDNVLLIIADDVGAEKITAFADDIGHDNPAITPNIDYLATQGVRFTQTWSNPTCSPTRAGINTGRHAIRHGIGAAITGSSDPFLKPSEETLAETLAPAVPSALLGKWHLGTDASQGGADAPRQAGGYARHAGGLTGALPSYTRWPKATDGVMSIERTYATFDTANETVDWINGQSGQWFAAVAFNAGHTPFHVPPGYEGELSGVNCSNPNDDILCYRAMVETLDTEVAGILDAIQARGELDDTTIIFVGDNGTANQVVEAPYQSGKAKGTVYEGGVHVPLIIAADWIDEPGRAVATPVHIVDIFATVLEVAGQGAALDALAARTTLDSVSLVPHLLDADAAPVRDVVYTEGFGDGDPSNANAAMTDGHFKLIRTYTDGLVTSEELYNLRTAAANGDPEASDLLARPRLTVAAAAAYDNLSARMDALRASAGY